MAQRLLDGILTFNLICGLLIYWTAARIYVLPHLGRWDSRTVLMPILILHSTRQLGLMFLSRGATYPGMPREFSVPAALGDLLAAILAFLALIGVAGRKAWGRPLVWAFNVEGTLDLLAAIVLATAYNAPPFMGAAYWIPAFWVPALLVTHAIVFRILLGPAPHPA